MFQTAATPPTDTPRSRSFDRTNVETEKSLVRIERGCRGCKQFRTRGLTEVVHSVSGGWISCTLIVGRLFVQKAAEMWGTICNKEEGVSKHKDLLFGRRGRCRAAKDLTSFVLFLFPGAWGVRQMMSRAVESKKCKARCST